MHDRGIFAIIGGTVGIAPACARGVFDACGVVPRQVMGKDFPGTSSENRGKAENKEKEMEACATRETWRQRHLERSLATSQLTV